MHCHKDDYYAYRNSGLLFSLDLKGMKLLFQDCTFYRRWNLQDHKVLENVDDIKKDEFNSFETNKNIIVNSKESIYINKQDVLRMVIFVLVLINSIEHSIFTFEDMIGKEYSHV